MKAIANEIGGLAHLYLLSHLKSLISRAGKMVLVTGRCGRGPHNINSEIAVRSLSICTLAEGKPVCLLISQ